LNSPNAFSIVMSRNIKLMVHYPCMEEINMYRIGIAMIRLENPRHRWDDGKMYRVEAG